MRMALAMETKAPTTRVPPAIQMAVKTKGGRAGKATAKTPKAIKEIVARIPDPRPTPRKVTPHAFWHEFPQQSGLVLSLSLYEGTGCVPTEFIGIPLLRISTY
jgi:hypothetical protein